MKRFLSFLTAALCASFAYAQAPAVNNYPEMSVIARFDYPVLPYVYTLLEGDLGEHFSYSVCNHWLSDDPSSLYANTWHSDSCNWCDWANLTASFGNWAFTLGKDTMVLGSYEIDAYDYDSFWEMNSNFWNNANVYQWGGKVSYTTPSECTTLDLQLSSSPFDVKPFETGLLAYGLRLTGEYGIYCPIWSVNSIDYGTDASDKIYLFVSGNQFDLTESLSLGFDYMYRSTITGVTAPGAPKDSKKYRYNEGHNFSVFANISLGDHFALNAKYGLESADGTHDDLFEIPDRYSYGGFCLQYFPLKDSQDLRIHALACANRYTRPEMFGDDIEYVFSAGITYNFSLSNLLFKR